jgi:outer membrane murein-binding lipoprotein Lpp
MKFPTICGVSIPPAIRNHRCPSHTIVRDKTQQTIGSTVGSGAVSTMSAALLSVAVLAGCAPTPEQQARNAQVQLAAERLPMSAKLECQMNAQMAAASASDPRALIDIYAAATGAQVRDTCLAMMIMRYGTLNSSVALASSKPSDYCADTSIILDRFQLDECNRQYRTGHPGAMEPVNSASRK